MLMKKTFDKHIVYDLTGLRAGRFVEPKYFKQMVVVMGEGRLKPVNAVEKKGEVFRRVDGMLD